MKKNETETLTQKEKEAHLRAKIQKAQDEGNEEDEEYYTILLKYLLEVENMTINVYEGGTVVFQSGKPNVPPY